MLLPQVKPTLFSCGLKQKRPHLNMQQTPPLYIIFPHQLNYNKRNNYLNTPASAAQRTITALLLRHTLTPTHLSTLKHTWQRATAHSLMLLSQLQYLTLSTSWTKYKSHLNRAILKLPASRSKTWAPTLHHKLYQFSALLDAYLTTNDLALIQTMLQQQQPQRIIFYLQNILQKAPLKQQKKLFLDFCEYLKTLQRRMPLQMSLHGIRATLKGKINRSGSARKQKIIWQLGTTRRNDFRNRLYVTKAQARTSAGALGIELQFNYKVEC